MRRPGYFLVSFLLVLLISKIEWGSWFLNSNKGKDIDSSTQNGLPLQTVGINPRAFESHKLPISAEAAVVIDAKKGEILFQKDAQEELPIASLTKLMSALVFLKANRNLDDTISIIPDDIKCREALQLKAGQTFTLGDLLHASLMGSSNRATIALARSSGLSPAEFVAGMNQQAKRLGLENTHFYEPTGLDERNRSTALDCAKLLYFALQDTIVASILSKTVHEFSSVNEGKRRYRVKSTTKLLFNSLNVKGGKTGYNGASGWCLGAVVEGEEGEEMVAVILGAPSKHARFNQIRSIVKWSLKPQQFSGGYHRGN